MRVQSIAAPVGLALTLIMIGLGIATVIQGESPSTWLLRVGYAFVGALSVVAILCAWPHDVFAVDSLLRCPDAGDTHQYLDEPEAHHGAIDLGYLGETECAAAAPIHYVAAPEPSPSRPLPQPRSYCWPFMSMDVPPRRPGETHDEYRLRLAESYALSFPQH